MGGPAGSSAGSAGGEVQPTPVPRKVLTVVLLVQFAEAFQLCVLFPYVPFMVASFPDMRPEQVGTYSGLLAAAFAFGQFVSSYFWGVTSDRIGEKAVILISMTMTLVCTLVFGFSGVFHVAYLARFCAGLFNGNIGVIKTYLGKNTDASNQTKAMGLVSGAWVIGSILSPALGGLLAQPATQYPGHFSEDGFFGRYPFCLPSLCTAFVLACSWVAALVLVEDDKFPRLSWLWRRFKDAVSLRLAYCCGSTSLAPKTRRFTKPGLRKRRSEGTYERIVIDSSQINLASASDEDEDDEDDGDAVPHGWKHVRGEVAVLGGRDQGEGEQVEGLELEEAKAEVEVLDLHDPTELERKKELLPIGPPLSWQDKKNMFFTAFMYGLVCFIYVCLDETFPLFCRTPVEEGGLSFQAGQIGITLAIMGIVDLIYIFTLFPYVTKRMTGMSILRVSSWMMVPVLAVYPLISLLAANFQAWVFWTVLLITVSMRGILSTNIYTPVMVFINNSVPKHHMGKANGVGQSFAAGTRGSGPALAGLMWSLLSQTTFPFHTAVTFLFSAALTLALIGFTYVYPKHIEKTHAERMVLTSNTEGNVEMTTH